MKIFKKDRIALYIGFIVFTVAVLFVVIFIKINKNVIIGEWISSDNERRYVFEENILTITHIELDESYIYGYEFKNNNLLILQTRENEYRYFSVRLGGNEMIVMSDDSDSPEILRKVDINDRNTEK